MNNELQIKLFAIGKPKLSYGEQYQDKIIAATSLINKDSTTSKAINAIMGEKSIGKLGRGGISLRNSPSTGSVIS